MKKYFLLATLIFFFSNISFAGDKVINLKIASVAPEESVWGKLYNQFRDILYELTGSKVRITHYPGGIMGDEPDIIRKMKFGQLQGAALSELGLTSIIPQIRLLNMVMFFKNFDEWDAVRKNLFDDFAKLAEKRGFVLVGYTEVGAVRIFSKHLFRTLEEFKKARLWIWAGDPFVELMAKEGLGVTPVVLNITEVLQGLQTGMVDTFYGPPYAILALQWFRECKYMSKMIAGFASGGVVVPKKVYYGLPEKVREAIHIAWKRVFPELRDEVRKLDKKTYEQFLKMGIEPIEINEEDMKILQKRTVRLNRKVAEMIDGVDIYNKILKIVDDNRKKSKLNKVTGK